jgi:hypothetical protein
MLGVDHYRRATNGPPSSCPSTTVAAMMFQSVFPFDYSSLLLAGVLIGGFILISARRTQLNPRSVLLARLGLGALALKLVAGLAWVLASWSIFLSPLTEDEYSTSRYGLVSTVLSLVLSLLFAAGIGLLIAAVATGGAADRFAPSPAFAPGGALADPGVAGDRVTEDGIAEDGIAEDGAGR